MAAKIRLLKKVLQPNLIDNFRALTIHDETWGRYFRICQGRASEKDSRRNVVQVQIGTVSHTLAEHLEPTITLEKLRNYGC